MNHVFAIETRLVSNPKTGGTESINIGEHWLADDPVVKAYPHLFTNDPRYGLRSSLPFDGDGYPAGHAPAKRSADATETATAAPGEKRSRK
jgi:hypothetical protein